MKTLEGLQAKDSHKQWLTPLLRSLCSSSQEFTAKEREETWWTARHLRELTFVEEELKQSWAKKMKELLLQMKAEVEQAKAVGQHELAIPVLAHFLRRYDEIEEAGGIAVPARFRCVIRQQPGREIFG